MIGSFNDNQVLMSNTFSDGSWGVTRATVTAAATTAPDGTTTGWKLTEDTTVTSAHFLQQSVATRASSSIILFTSIYVKASVRDIQIQIGDVGGGNGATGYYDMTGKTLSGSATFGTGFTLLGANIITDNIATGTGGNSWYRIYCGCITTVDTGNSVEFILNNPAQTNSYTGDGASGIFLWGAQYNIGPSSIKAPKPYFVTTTKTLHLLNTLPRAGILNRRQKRVLYIYTP